MVVKINLYSPNCSAPRNLAKMKEVMKPQEKTNSLPASMMPLPLADLTTVRSSPDNSYPGERFFFMAGTNLESVMIGCRACIPYNEDQ
jgi:hypothetical protein